MTEFASPSSSQLGATGLRVWRVIAAFGFLATSVATHWPKLVFGPEAPSDKILHAAAFGVLTFLLWRTRWIGSVWVLALTMVVYAAIDESTQSLPWIQRHTSLDDYYADVIGISLAVLLIWKQPARRESKLSRMRAALTDAAEREMFCRPFTWIAIATSAALAVLVGVPLTVVFGKFVLFDEHPLQTAFISGFFFAVVGIALTWRSALRAAVLRVTRERMCFRCGQHIVDDKIAVGGSCIQCGEMWRHTQWVRPSSHYGSFRIRPSRRTFVYAGIAVAFAFLVPRLFLSLGVFLWSVQSPSMQDLQDLITYSIAIAALVLVRRSFLLDQLIAREKEGSFCQGCAHNLQGVIPSREVGICPECEAEFVSIKA